MIQISNLQELNEENIYKLVDLVKPELDRKTKLYQRYTRKSGDISIIGNNKQVTVPFEKYIVDMGAGYLGGKEPTYEVESTEDETKKNVIQKVLDKIVGQPDYKESMEVIMNYITNYNNDGNENYQLVHDILSTGSCYEILYENNDNEKVYARTNPLQTQAIWDYSVPRQLIGIVQLYTETDINNTITNVVQLTDKIGTRVFKGGKGGSNTYEEVKQYDREGNEVVNNHNWKDVPFTCVEVPNGTALFEPVLDLIKAYEKLIQNTKDTFNYNANAKLKVTGYRPEEPLLIEENGKLVTNKKREQLDKTMLDMQVFYTPEDGDIDWITKDMDDGVIQNTLKTYIDLIMMNTGVPQITDLGFTKADNASAIDRKFFALEQMTIEAMQLLKTAYKRRWELIFDRINLAKNTKYDFRDIKITLNKNLPANEQELVNMYLRLRGLISDETIIERLPLNFDATSELDKMNSQEEEELNKEVQKASAFNNVSGNKEDKKEDKNVVEK